jgi:hypothetical protein
MSAGAGAGAGARVVCSGEGVDDVVANAPECCGLWLAVVWYWVVGGGEEVEVEVEVVVVVV